MDCGCEEGGEMQRAKKRRTLKIGAKNLCPKSVFSKSVEGEVARCRLLGQEGKKIWYVLIKIQ